jgi:hypothetical protein
MRPPGELSFQTSFNPLARPVRFEKLSREAFGFEGWKVEVSGGLQFLHEEQALCRGHVLLVVVQGRPQPLRRCLKLPGIGASQIHGQQLSVGCDEATLQIGGAARGRRTVEVFSNRAQRTGLVASLHQGPDLGLGRARDQARILRRVRDPLPGGYRRGGIGVLEGPGLGPDHIAFQKVGLRRARQ